MDKESIVIAVLLLLFGSLFVGMPYGAYKYGRFVERRELTRYFIHMTQETYEDGYKDGEAIGLNKGRMEILLEEEANGR